MYEEKKRISHTEDTIISLIYYPKIDNYACQKQIFISEPESLKKCYREINMLTFLKNSPNCIYLYETHEILNSPDPSLVLITEYCERGNLLELGKYIKEQNQNFSHYITYYVKKSIRFLSKLQKQSISHRDIKPENIFITASGDIKFGDFGSSTSTLASKKFTIQGSPYYLSPELREGFYKYETQGGDSRILYSPHLSDVYSLGLIFLYLCTLEPIDERFCDLEYLEENLRVYIDMIQDQYLKKIISWMVKFKSNERPDFITLEQDLLKNKFFQCYACALYDSDTWASCDNCYRDFHTYCVSSKICGYCQGDLKYYCIGCRQMFDELKIVKDSLCDACIYIENDYYDPQNFQYNEEMVNSDLLPVNIACIRCRNDCILCPDSYFCQRCEIYFCRKCKRCKHAGICSHNEIGKFIICNCKSLIQEKYFEDIFFLCNKCGYICIVCLKSIKNSHINCSYMINNRI